MAGKTTVYPLQQETNVDVGATPVEVLVDNNNQTVESTTQASPVEIVVPDTTIYTVGVQGPPGVSEDEMAYALRVDFAADGFSLYRAEALPGALNSAPAWRIRYITIDETDGDVITKWADGDSEFNNIWDNRAILPYS